MPRNVAQYHHLTKIVATLSSRPETTVRFIKRLFDAGMSVARLNTAHMSADELHAMVQKIRQVSPTLAVMVDTKGPNIRTCNVPQEGIPVKQGETIRISGKQSDDGRICVNYEPFTDEVPVGSRIVCDDGAVKLNVTGKDGDCLLAEVQFDSVLCNKKSINVPDVSLKAPALTDKDREFLRLAPEEEIDFIAHSFVRNADDVRQVRQALGKKGKDIKIIAKIENREGVNNIDEILAEADGLMVARGDLGIEIPLEQVPAIQKKLIFAARKAAKPVIVATQMLQSMISSPAPTRAEVSDVANAVYDGTDAVMLSGETANGAYPVEAVKTMRTIVFEAEHSPRQFFTDMTADDFQLDTATFLLGAAITSIDLLPIKVVICSTLNGTSARFCSALRPSVPVFAPTPLPSTLRQLALSYGIYPVEVPFNTSPTEQGRYIHSGLKKSADLLDPDDLIVVLGKFQESTPKNNVLYIAPFKELMSNEY